MESGSRYLIRLQSYDDSRGCKMPCSPFQLEGGWGVGVALDETYPLAPFLKERGISPFTS